MKHLVRIAALLESVTGLALIIDPALVAHETVTTQKDPADMRMLIEKGKRNNAASE